MYLRSFSPTKANKNEDNESTGALRCREGRNSFRGSSNSVDFFSTGVILKLEENRILDAKTKIVNVKT